MNGQWFGDYKLAGQRKGRVTLNLERIKDYYCGCLITDGPTYEPSVVYNVTLSKGSGNQVSGAATFVSYVDRISNSLLDMSRSELRSHFPHVEHTTSRIEIAGVHLTGTLQLGYAGAYGNKGTAILKQHAFKPKTQVPLTAISWRNFRNLLIDDAWLGGCIFRGQSHPHPLRTSFHRAGRMDTMRFLREDLRHLQTAISSVIDISFDLSRSEDARCVVGIAQHHGYPTPSLDWTKSPYVAAYFACSDIMKGRDLQPTIFAFDRRNWRPRSPLPENIDSPLPALSFIESVPLKNPRFMPQQSVLLYSNMHNIEHFVLGSGKPRNTLLKAFALTDSPEQILRDLRRMGIYAASMFPGLDGMCRGVFEESLGAIDSAPARNKPGKRKERK